MTNIQTQPIYHLVPAGYYQAQPKDKPYWPETFAQEGFIHCTAGTKMLIKVANAYFNTLTDDLLVLQIDPQFLTSPLKFEPPVSAVLHSETEKPSYHQGNVLFPHVYGPLNRQAIANCFLLQRNLAGCWCLPD